MTIPRILAVTFTALLSAATFAQEASALASQAAEAPAMPAPCAMPAARHDHGAEKGTPTPRMAGCPMAAASDSATAKPKAKVGHDHSKFHKLM